MIIQKIIRNNPNMFSNADEICKNLCCYRENTRGKKIIDYPKNIENILQGGSGGIPISYDGNKGKVYVDHTDRHSVIIGQTGAKKSRLVAMPLVYILGAAKESMIISDPKAEIYHRTSGYLKNEGYEIRVINLREPKKGDAWNPLAIAYKFYMQGDIDKAYEFANDIAVNLIAIDKSQTDAFWDNSAGTLFFGLTILLFKMCAENNEDESEVNIRNVLMLRKELFSKGDPSEKALWRYAQKDKFIESMLIGSVMTARDTRAGILSVFDEKMRVFSVQPSLLDMLSQNDGEYDLVRERPSAIYLLLPDEKTGYHSLVSLYIKQSYEYYIYKAQQDLEKGKEYGNRINYILDEFSSLPAISDFPAMITAARSRNIRFNLFLQSKKQLILKYHEDSDTIMSNCENWIYLFTRELDFLKELSELCGENSSKRSLLSVSDLQRLDKERGETLILTGRNKPLITYLPDIDFYDSGTPLTVADTIKINDRVVDREFDIRMKQIILNTIL